MKIDCISDLHGFYPELEGGDLLIVAGDLTALDTKDEYIIFCEWIWKQKYRKKIIISGNHDGQIETILNDCKIPDDLMLPKQQLNPFMLSGAEYLCDSGTEFEGLKIWGSPWTLRFEGENPKAMAFTCETEEELAAKFACIPEDTDILVTHSPPLSILDRTVEDRRVGSLSLCGKLGRLNPKLHVFGHIHESYGVIMPYKDYVPTYVDRSNTIYVNASHVNERYEPVNKPVRIEL